MQTPRARKKAGSSDRKSAGPGWAAMAAVGALILAGAPVQGHVDEGDLEAALAAQFAMVADPLWGVEAGSAGVLYERQADAITGMASIGKAWLTHIGLHAIELGWIDPDEPMTITPDSLNQFCNCFLDVNNQRVAAGEQFRFGEALRAQHLRSSNELAQSVAEHVGLKFVQASGFTCAFGPFPSECLEWYFFLANLHAGNVGVSAATVFNRPESLDATTARDVLKMWTHALEEQPEYAAWAAPGSITIQSLPPLSRTFPAAANEAILGLEARKGGNNDLCNRRLPGMSCYVSSAERIGRRLVAVQGASNRVPDAVALYDHGFAKTFHPEPAGLSAPWAPVQDHALACVSGSKAVSAALKANGVPRLVLWDVDVEARSITTAAQANPVLVPGNLDLQALAPPALSPAIRNAGINDLPDWIPAVRPVNALLAAGPEPGIPALPLRNPLPLPPPPALPGDLALPQVPLGPVVEVDVAPLGSTAFVFAQRGAAAVALSTWGIDGSDLVPLGSTVFPAPGLQGLQLLGLTDNRFLLALHQEDGDRRFQSWRAHGDGSLQLVDVVPAEFLWEYDLAAQPYLGAPLVFVAGRGLGNSLAVETWTMDPDGTLHQRNAGAAVGGAYGVAVSAAPVEALPGEFIVDPHFAVVFRGSDGWARMNHWSQTGLGLSSVGSAVVSTAALPDSTVFDLAPLGSSGLLLAKRAGAIGVDLDVFESRRDSADVDALFVVGHTVDPVDDLRGLCKVPRPAAGAPSEGDYLLATDEFFQDGLQLSGWRVAERPH